MYKKVRIFDGQSEINKRIKKKNVGPLEREMLPRGDSGWTMLRKFPSRLNIRILYLHLYCMTDGLAASPRKFGKFEAIIRPSYIFSFKKGHNQNAVIHSK